VSSQLPFTPLTPDDLARLEPAERMAFTVAAGQVARDVNPGINTTAALLLTIQRLIGEALERAETAREAPASDDTGRLSPASEASAGPRARPSLPIDAAGFRDLIEPALDASVDRCARCKVCEHQLDAVMAVAWPLLEHAQDAAAGSHEGVRLWMLDCGALTARHRERAERAEGKLLECMEQATACRERAEAVEARCAALEGAAGEAAGLRSQLASAQNAIGQLIRWSQSVLMEEGRAARKRFARWLLDELAPWTGQERSEEESGA
jgi:hypothetical protein